MLPVDADVVRLFLHVLAATVWVGGQLTLAGLVPALRRASPDAPRAAARAFNRVAWPAFGVLIVTGLWNVAAIDVEDASRAYLVTLLAKLVVVALSGLAAAAHTVAKTRSQLAIGGAAAATSALVALFFGVLLHAQ